MGRLVWLFGLAACSFHPGNAPRADGPAGDVPVADVPADIATDAAIDAVPTPTPIEFVTEGHGQWADNLHNTVTVTIANEVAGNFNAVVLSWYTPGSTLLTLTDSAGNLYTLADSATDGTRVQSVYYSANITASASDAVTAVWSGNAMYCEIRIAQYSGLAKTSPVDKAVHTTGNTSSQSIGPINTTHAHDLLFAAIVGSSTMPGAGYSQRISFVGDFVEDRVVTTTGSFLATASGTATNWVGQLVAFKGAN